MQLIDLYLRAETESAMREALRSAGLVVDETDDSGQPVERITGEPNTSVDVIGEIQEQTGTEIDPETGDEMPVYESAPGWHVNVVTRDSELPDKLASVTIDEPSTPKCTWAD